MYATEQKDKILNKSSENGIPLPFVLEDKKEFHAHTKIEHYERSATSKQLIQATQQVTTT